MDIKKQVKTNITLKKAQIIDEKLVDETGTKIDIIHTLKKVYGEDVLFDLSITKTNNKELTLDDFDDEDEDE